MNEEAEVVDEAVDEQAPVVLDPSATTKSDQEGKDKAEKGIEKALKDTKAELTRVQQERAEERRLLEEKLSKLEGMVSVLMAAKPAAAAQPEQEMADPFDFLDSKDFEERFYEDVNVPKQALKRMVTIIGSALFGRDAEWERRLEQQKAELLALINRPDPTLAEKIAALKKDPELAGLDDKALAIIAKRYMKAEPTERREYPGVAPDGNRRPKAAAVDPEFERLVQKQLKEKYGDA